MDVLYGCYACHLEFDKEAIFVGFEEGFRILSDFRRLNFYGPYLFSVIKGGGVGMVLSKLRY